MKKLHIYDMVLMAGVICLFVVIPLLSREDFIETSAELIEVINPSVLKMKVNGRTETVKLYGLSGYSSKTAQYHGRPNPGQPDSYDYHRILKQLKSETVRLVNANTANHLRLQYNTRDIYGRIKGWVILDDNRVLNALILKEGLAYPAGTGKLRYSEEMISARKEAEQNKKNLWAF